MEFSNHTILSFQILINYFFKLTVLL